MEKFNVLSIITLLMLAIFMGCDVSDSNHLSPEKVVKLYFKAKEEGDVATLNRIMYFPAGTSDQEKEEKIISILDDPGEKILSKAMGVKLKTEYEKIIDHETAEVGVVMFAGLPGLKRRMPFQQAVLKKEKGAWKYYSTTHRLTEEELISRIRKDPFDASAIYLLGRKYQPANPARADRYLMKYYQLEPKGFWVNREFLSNIKSTMDVETEEREYLSSIESMPKNAAGRSGDYRKLGQLFIEQGDYQKARMYLDKAVKALERSGGGTPYDYERLGNAQKLLEAEMSGKVYDVLKELEAKGVYDQ